MAGHEHTRLRAVRSPYHGDEHEDRMRFGAVGGDDDPPPPGALVVGVDGSAVAAEALRWAVHHGERTGVPVYALAVSASPQAGQQWLHRALSRAGEGRRDSGFRVVVRSGVREGDPADVLPALARDAALLVLGTGHGDGTLGAVGRQCLAQARCPVLLVPAPREEGGAPA
jgi:nucleotide-binding universal stress UspA family protein